MATVLEEYSTEKQSFVVRFFCGQKDTMQRIFIKKCFLFMVGSVCRVKRFTTLSRNSLKDVRMSQMMSDQVLRQQLKDFYAAGFDALVKRCDNCCLRICLEKMFCPCSNIIYFMFYTYL
jgi:hypothetical protein